ncbi:M42 family metallopeptidase [Clostridium felsineum]|uniref:M42 family metallopeptidase n=1 Tax=Clostridium felsineum TaxID=36839 RepID=UPI00098C61A1|nr:M42 family metallopeptidase [Clostridium felsineum]URZ18303.1 Putative aminopeptidase YsdC [Clostridium felsineum DSM 794]
MDTKLLLKELCLKDAPSGVEKELFDTVNREFSEFCDVEMDELNNIYASKKGKGMGKIALMAHGDEIFLMVSGFEKNGFLKFKAVGIDPKVLISQEVKIHGKKDVLGIIGIKPPHLMNEKEKEEGVKVTELLIDTGISTEKLKEIVSIGDYVTIKRDFYELLNDNVACKAMDNRASITAMYVCARELSHISHNADVVFICSCQEEVGHRGAKMSAYKVKPDICIAIDVTFDGGKLGDPDRENEVGGGPVICIGPNIHAKVRKKIIETANKYNIPYKVEVEPGNTGCDAWDTQISGTGIPSLLISVPEKYMHTSVEVVNVKDIENVGILIAKFVEEMNNVEMEELLCF